MKQSDIVPGYEHYVKTMPYNQNTWDWTGLDPYKFPREAEVICVVLAKGIEQNRRKDRIEVRAADTDRFGDTTYLVPARHIVESLQGREERYVQEEYNRQWAEALRENEQRDKVDSYEKGRLGDLIADRESDTRRRAGKLLSELRDLKREVDKQIEAFEEASTDGERVSVYSYKLKDGAEYPSTDRFGGVNRVMTEANNVREALVAYAENAKLMNELREITKVEEAEESDES